MYADNIIIKGNKEGLNVIIDMKKFRNSLDMTNALIEKLSKGKRFYRGCTLKITTQLKEFTDRELRRLRDLLFEEFLIRDCIFQDIDEKQSKMFNGIYEGRTKYLKRTIRSGQVYEYSGNLVIIGDINPGAEVYAAGNIVVVGAIRGSVHAGCTGNDKSFIAAFSLEPQIIRIADIMTRSPEDGIKPAYPEVARVKNGSIIVEPYLVNKYI
ncbi:MAG: septum site-determining protein MinC [Clostridium argentinense]|uniref:Probable septum site-determining protein MinC n=1 Tax=Clostridium faecium TaxID=2762223 RepID=A0ABR8YS07_9CLOT|nr:MULTISPECIES: septum site-determining protein MinC [Clostridium]MBD8047031.1 septum site-determining protein MinC [Clostridium faecium]MBS5824712.1 septum site-determining protein MinC [Clostridium argentinense]MDU1348195.1 septum site-determining protein MinC [Clostridium argentinense]